MPYSTEPVFTALDLKSIAGDGVFEGYASLFNAEDLGRDVIMPGAFRDSLAARGVSGVRMLFQHMPSEPIGVWEELREDPRGLFVRGRLAAHVARADEVLALLRAGAIDGLSIGFRVVKANRDRLTGARRIAKVDLWEISIVTFPMQPAARIDRVSAPSSRPPASRGSQPFAARVAPDAVTAVARRVHARLAATTHAAPVVRAHALAGERLLLSLVRLGLSGGDARAERGGHPHWTRSASGRRPVRHV